tara:strand:- start:1396 stop:1662 length:267 start_codon:yes stop_codon:yes gene_type:complete
MNKAKVLWFNNQKGYGYCVEETSGEEVFIHYSTIKSEQEVKTLEDGQIVYLELIKLNNKLCANNVIPIDRKKKEPKKPTKTSSNSLSI